ncbi:ATP synthase F0 subunit B [Desulfoplanes sp.]
MIELNVTFFIQFVNFLITLMVLNLILYRPIRGILKRRAEHLAKSLAEVEDFNAGAGEKLKSYEDGLATARSEAQAVRNSRQEEGYGEEKTIVGGASKEAASFLGSARKEIASESESALSTLKGKVDEYAKAATGKILSKA